MNIPERGTQALRRYRWSCANASYFVTLCTRDRRPGLADLDVFEQILSIANDLNGEGWLAVRVLTLMPDHLHAVVCLGDRGELSDAMRLFKGRSSVVLRNRCGGWQKNGCYEHRLRPEEALLPVFHYIFMNPYRKRLTQADAGWPYFYCREEDRLWYKPGHDQDIPYPEWLL